jgi:hypothetical protein
MRTSSCVSILPIVPLLKAYLRTSQICRCLNSVSRASKNLSVLITNAVRCMYLVEDLQALCIVSPLDCRLSRLLTLASKCTNFLISTHAYCPAQITVPGLLPNLFLGHQGFLLMHGKQQGRPIPMMLSWQQISKMCNVTSVLGISVCSIEPHHPRRFLWHSTIYANRNIFTPLTYLSQPSRSLFSSSEHLFSHVIVP